MRKVLRHSQRTLLMISLLFTGAGIQAEDEKAKSLYITCLACHGDKGQGNKQLEAPAIAGLSAWYIESQLLKFKDGVRGAHPQDVEGLRMRPMMRAIAPKGYKEGDPEKEKEYNENIKILSAYVATFIPEVPEATLEGDSEKGKNLYMTCLACHGAEGKGNKALGSPNQNYIQDWYLLTQLKKFKAGVRGKHPDDTWGKTMQPMAGLLADEQAMKDVIAYIRTLQEKAKEK